MIRNRLIVQYRHRQYVRTTNLIERTFVETRRRTKTIPHLWNEKSFLKLVFGALIRVSDRWAQPSFSTMEEEIIKNLRNKILGGGGIIRLLLKERKKLEEAMLVLLNFTGKLKLDHLSVNSLIACKKQ